MLNYIHFCKDKVFTTMKDTLLNVRVKQETVDELNQISEVLDVPYSQIVREAIKEKIEKLQIEKPELKKLLKKPVFVNV